MGPLIHYLPSPAFHPLVVSGIGVGTTSPPSQNQGPLCVDMAGVAGSLHIKSDPLSFSGLYSPFTQLDLAPSKKPHIHPALPGRGH